MSESADRQPDLRLWGKEKNLARPYPVLWHLLDTAAIAGVLWDRYLSPSQRSLISTALGVSNEHAGRLATFWAGLHDLGKITPRFQSREAGAHAALRGDPQFPPAIANERLRHERASQQVATGLLQKIGYDDNDTWSINGCYRVAQLLGGHHGLFKESTRDAVRTYAGTLGQAGWQTQRALHFDAVHEAVGRPAAPDIASQPDGTLGAHVAAILTGLIILADWLASQEWFLTSQLSRAPIDSSSGSVRAHLDRTSTFAPRVLRHAGLGRLQLRDRGFGDVFGFAPNPLQQSVIDELVGRLDGPGLLVVTAATGDGKTEVGLVAATALAGASGVDGIHFALPTMATADQMYKRVAAFTQKVASGSAPVTLLHSMSWLNAEYVGRAAHGLAEPSPIVSTECDDAVVAASDWLRGPKRGLLASMSAGTIDQALLAALATKHNSLRMLGLSRKVLIVDEAHAYDAYMQAVLRQLLCWLGAMGAPVVLLSATLPSTVAGSLASAYRRGAGQETVDQPPWTMGYPSWLFVPAGADRDPIRISPRAAAAVAAHRTLTLDVDIRPVTRAAGDHLGGRAVAGGRMAVVREILEPISTRGGCVAIVCNTVKESQETYEGLHDLRASGVDVRLLHARFPARVREEKTQDVVDELGLDGARAGRRPQAIVVVATQVIEQSLDLDFDLVISDLSPVAQLLQRAGRCHRHEQPRPRPAWVGAPRLVVLDPVSDGAYAKPDAWGNVYSEYLLRATHRLLAERDGRPVRVPADIQGMVETVYVSWAGPNSFLNDGVLDNTVLDDTALDDEVLVQEWLKHYGDELAQRDMAGFVALPDPGDIEDLSRLSVKLVPEAVAATRLGADSVRVLCCYVDEDGDRWLDPQLQHERLPERGSRPDGTFLVDEVRELLARTIPMRAEEVLPEPAPEYARPARWDGNPWLSKIALLPHRVTAEGVQPVPLGKRSYLLDDEVGLMVLR